MEKFLKFIAAFLFVTVCGVLLWGSTVYTVNQTQLANVRRLGKVIYGPQNPIGPGLHFKVPIIDRVDKLQISLTTLHIPAFDVLTVDNQKVTLDTNFNFTIPKNKVYHLLYEVGSAGSFDIDAQVVPVVKDRIARVFASQNMVNVNANRELIQAQVSKEVFKAIKDLFGLEPHSMQIASITPSPGFMQSIDEATKAKNQAIAAENTKRTIQFQADQKVIAAKGEADAAAEKARGEKTKLELEAQGYQAQISAFGTPSIYVDYIRAKAAANWNGQSPQIVSTGGAGTNIVVPIPGLK